MTENSQNRDIQARASTGAESDWYKGHFHDKPILPGIAQIMMAFEAIRRNGESQGMIYTIKSVRKVRFRRIVSPDEKIDMVIKPDIEEPSRFTFKSFIKGELACTGILLVSVSK